ncbi:MAG: cytochrome c oxidase assembly protein [Thermocrispum sp.]
MQPPVRQRRSSGVAALVAVGSVLAVVIAVLLLVQTGGTNLGEITGLRDPGPLTTYGVTVVRLLAELSAVVVIGSLLLAALLVPPQRSGTLAADGYGAVRVAGIASWCWVFFAVASAVFTAAESAGRPVADVLDPQVFAVLVDAVELPKAWLITASVALLLALGCRLTLSWGWTAVLFVFSLLGLVPLGVTGHSSTGGSHDVATNSLLIHLVAAALWVGGLVALVALGKRRSTYLPLAARRFSRLALVCWIAMAASGVINALVRITPAQLFDNAYGLLLLAKLVALGVLGVFGQQQRVRGVRALREAGSRGPLLRLAGVEVLVMCVTLGIAAALARTPTPDDTTLPGRTEVLIGYQLDGPPSLDRMLFDWRFDLIYGTAAILLAVLYVAGVRRLRKRGDSWPVGRTAAWLGGCATILIATSSGIGKYSPAMFSVHMGTHMLLSMVAPVMLVLGGATTLALRALPPAGKSAPPGPREWILAAVQSPVARFLTHPIVALALFVGSFYALYFSGLFDTALEYHWAHLAMNAHFLLVGYLFFWPLIGVDPAPRRLMPLGRLGVMFASMPFHAFFGVILMNSQTVIGETFYTQLKLPWAGDLLTEQRLGGGIAWAFGEVPALIVLITLMVQWARADEREAKRTDRKADRGGPDDDLAAYNAMLAQLAGKARKPE